VYRGIGAYSPIEFEKFVAMRARGLTWLAAWLIARAPGWMANGFAGAYCLAINRNAMNAFDLARAPSSTWISRMAARHLGEPGG
jgi:hypothetical protein